MGKKRLGKGLSALIPKEEENNEFDQKSGNIKEIKVENIVPNPYQPRKDFNSEALRELAESIKEHGVIQPISVRKVEDKYQLIAGERRLRASKMANLKTIPAIEKKLDERQVMEIALIENLQREDLTPIEEAMAYKKLIDEFGLTQGDVSKRVGKSRSAIANTIRLLKLPKKIQDYVSRETLSMGHARTLLSISDENEMLKICDIAIKNELTVRQLEKLIKDLKDSPQDKKEDKSMKEKDSEVIEIEKKLRSIIGTSVRIKDTKDKKMITIECKNKEDLHRILSMLEKK